MPDYDSDTLRYWLARHNAGDPAALNELLRFSQDRALDHVRARLPGTDRLRRYVDSGDVLTGVQLDVFRGFATKPFTDLAHYLRLTALLVRHRVADLARHYFGPQGPGDHEHQAPAADPAGAGPPDPPDRGPSPSHTALRAEIDEVIAKLPDDHRELFDLLFYVRLTRAEAADALGVALSTLDRRWLAAREAFLDRYGNDLPF